MKGNKAYSNSIAMCILHAGSYYSNDKGCCDMRWRRYVELIKSSTYTRYHLAVEKLANGWKESQRITSDEATPLDQSINEDAWK